MDGKITLKQQFEAMNTGDVMLTKANRATIFVNAKRAKITVSTKTVEDQTQVTKTGELRETPAPIVNGRDAVTRAIFELSAADRLKVFENFELCCGNNQGQCICEVEPVRPIASPVGSPAGMNDAMAKFMAKLDSKPIIEEVEEAWELTNDKATLNDDGRWYRYQYLTANPKKRRLVMVDEEDYTSVIKIIGQ